MKRDKMLKMIVILAAIVVIAGSISKLLHRDSLTLMDYADLHPTPQPGESLTADPSNSEDPESGASEGWVPAPSGESQGPEGQTPQPTGGPSHVPSGDNGSQASLPSEEGSSSLPSKDTDPSQEQPVGAVLNGSSMEDQRVSLTEDFYYEPLSKKLFPFMETGIRAPHTPH